MSKPAGLDFGAVMLAGMGAGVNLRLLTELLPDIEAAVVFPSLSAEREEEDADG